MVIQTIDVLVGVQIHELEIINVIIMNVTINNVIMMVEIVMMSIVLLDVENGELEIIIVKKNVSMRDVIMTFGIVKNVIRVV